ncbi:hypothetical protein [Pedobacter rhizosphaerae]|uniref:Cytochrome b562 n=1 Tax=Pedobacter rhizosphaerae TaxID=390241 RepID=A0A1H9ST19_9SPHI|nr:hypothetical protein [Pedobacter rhizosphaerae]SER88150.1 hypothetical protein SAMN04488023_11976 [Pedobacter rhizosphaerae]
MKKILILFSFVLAMTAQTNAQTIFDSWPELKAFHSVMSDTFHSAEEGNLNRIKQKSAELTAKASKMQNSLIPKAYKTPAIKASIEKLYMESKVLDQQVKSKEKDAVILKSLTALHDRFHEIVGLCREKNH